MEGCHLNVIRNNQTQLRVASYPDLIDHLPRNDNGGNPSVPVILTSSFSEIPRIMKQSYQDAIAVVCKYGKTDLFLSYTCNPNRSCESVTIRNKEKKCEKSF